MKVFSILLVASLTTAKVLVSRADENPELGSSVAEVEPETNRLEKLLTTKIEDSVAALMDRILRGEFSMRLDVAKLSEATTATAGCFYKERLGWPHGGIGQIKYDKVYEEANGSGSKFDSKSGQFTAGQTGVYQINLSANTGFTYDDSYLAMYLRTSSGKYQDGYEPEFIFESTVGKTNTFSPISASRFISMEKGEVIHLEFTCGGGCWIRSVKTCISLYK